ncbi:MAG: FtsX-like permease family protein [Pygmaiobacter sp.]|nr:FtsX-like permease family protein [Pygmaiobacter sp.]
MNKVNNRPAIARLARKSLRANRTRNLVAVAAIALTTMLFTALFTIAMTLANTFEQQTMRQIGGDYSGAFKDVTLEQMDELKTDPLIQDYGARLMLGMPQDVPFNKAHVEVSYMDAACAKHTFCAPEQGRLPAEGTMEIACDSRILQLLGVTPTLGATVTMPYQLSDGTKGADTFTLVGWWTYDQANIASMALVPRSYVENILQDYKRTPNDTTGKWTLNVNLKSNAHIEDDLRTILANHGYQCDDQSAENYIGIGVNWALFSTAFESKADPFAVLSMAAVLAVIVLTGYLIIYNIFQISVSNDIRFYGLLKTIGTTPRQIRSILRQQALTLCLAGIPLGLALGYGLGVVLAPATLGMLSYTRLYTSADPRIFVGAAVFSLFTVLISCAKPGRMAGKVSPIEAVRYTEGSGPKKAKRRAKNGGSPRGMALANLGRSGKKTALVVISLSLAVVLMQVTYSLATGFDMDKYLRNFVTTDFVVADAGYFQSRSLGTMTQADVEAIDATGLVAEGGVITSWHSAVVFVPEEFYRARYAGFIPEEDITTSIANEQRDAQDRVSTGSDFYGMEDFTLGKLKVFAGDVAALRDPTKKAIAAVMQTDDYGEPYSDSNFVKLGDTMTVRYVDEWESYNNQTGEIIPDPDEIADLTLVNQRPKRWHDVEYTVAALVEVPRAISFRYSGAPQFVLNRQVLDADRGTRGEALILNYAFNTAPENSDAMEDFLKKYTENEMPNLNYESKAIYVAQFDQLRGMFMLLGGVLSAVVAVVGVLNFLNAMLTSILARRREFAVLQAIGMTGRQLTTMLVWEGLLYALLAAAASLVLSLGVGAAMEKVVGQVLWFFTYRFTLLPLACVTPVFVALGVLIPLAVYRVIAKQTVVERLHAAE